MVTLIDLSHTLKPGESAYSWLPGPILTEFLAREDSRVRYAQGAEFVIHRIELIGNSGTYVDAPYHRYADGLDLGALPLELLAHLPGIVINATEGGVDGLGRAFAIREQGSLRGHAVLFRTGWDRKWGTADYASGHPFITEALAHDLVDAGVALVGIDALNVDDIDDLTRPAHTILLCAGIPIVESLCRLDQLPSAGFRFTAVPAAIEGCGAFPVRAFAVI
jgi:arylformamidase